MAFENRDKINKDSCLINKRGKTQVIHVDKTQAIFRTINSIDIKITKKEIL